MKQELFRWFNLRRDQAPAADIDAAVRANARAGGTNLWVLFFAMLIASVGLNVNSTAVIIGAMLISPLMGPIVAMGYGAAVADLRLIRSAALSLVTFTALSLLTSTGYFWLSPLNEPGSELLARTSPTLWDVLIAAFGGAAGMVAITRKSFSNIVPGVAIATALMPPLCTVGYGMAHQRWDMAGGAMYLFTINGVFIAAATLAVARVLKLPSKADLDDATRSLHRVVIGLGITVVLVPSVWMGYRLVQDEVFQGAAQKAVTQLEQRTGIALLGREIDPQGRAIRLTVMGEAEEAKVKEQAPSVLKAHGISNATLEFRSAGALQLQAIRRSSGERDQRIAALAEEMQNLSTRLQAVAGDRRPKVSDLLREVQALAPTVTDLTLIEPSAGAMEVRVTSSQRLHEKDLHALRAWLIVRLDAGDLQLIPETGPAPAKP